MVQTKGSDRRSKWLHAVAFGVLGLSGAAAEDIFPAYTASTQMVFYSGMVLLPLFIGLWPERHRRGYVMGWPLLLGSHACFLYWIRSVFPFHSIFAIFLMAIAESVILFVLMLKVLGDNISNSSPY